MADQNYESEDKIQIFIMVDPIWRNICKNVLDSDKNQYSGVFEIAAYGSKHQI